MIRIRGVCIVTLVAAAMMVMSPGNPRAQTDCKLYTVNASVLQVRKDANTSGVYVTLLKQGETVCVSNAPEVGPLRLVYVVHKSTDGGEPVAIGGWASLIFMTPQDSIGTASSGSAVGVVDLPSSQSMKQGVPQPSTTAKTAAPLDLATPESVKVENLSGYCLDNGSAGCQDRYIPFRDNSIDFCEETCSLENPVRVRGLKATLYDFSCVADSPSQMSGRVMIIRQTWFDGTTNISLVSGTETRPIVRCP